MKKYQVIVSTEVGVNKTFTVTASDKHEARLLAHELASEEVHLMSSEMVSGWEMGLPSDVYHYDVTEVEQAPPDWEAKYHALYHDYDNALAENSTYADEQAAIKKLFDELKEIKQYNKRNYNTPTMYMKAEDVLTVLAKLEDTI